MHRDTFHYPKLLRAPAKVALNIPSDGESTASLGNLFLTALTGKNFFLTCPTRPGADTSEGAGALLTSFTCAFHPMAP